VRDEPGGTRSEDPPGSLPPPTKSVDAATDQGPREPNDEADPIEQLRRLGELRDTGVVTEEQFEAKREELLRRI
jgi:hypothetical protein